MAETHVCKHTDRPTWILNVNTDKTGAWTAQIGELKAWLKAHDLEPRDVAAAAVVRRGDGSKQLHVRRYLSSSCDEHRAYRYVDWTTDEVASELVIVPLKMDPPHICGAVTR
jgi:hypothetical protein